MKVTAISSWTACKRKDFTCNASTTVHRQLEATSTRTFPPYGGRPSASSSNADRSGFPMMKSSSPNSPHAGNSTTVKAANALKVKLTCEPAVSNPPTELMPLSAPSYSARKAKPTGMSASNCGTKSNANSVLASAAAPSSKGAILSGAKRQAANSAGAASNNYSTLVQQAPLDFRFL
jgi:hypothetical protein